MEPHDKSTTGKYKVLSRKLGVGLAVIALLALFSIDPPEVRGHGKEVHDPAADSSLVTDTVADLSAAGLSDVLDSVYALIGSEYATIEPILKNSCYDCHTSQTDYPWYHRIPIISGMMDGHIKEAREHLEMSEGFPFGGHASQLGQLQEIREEVEENDMPLLSYRMMHWGTAIEGSRQDSLFAWIDSSIAQIKSVYQQFGLSIPGDDEEEEEE